MRNVVVIGGGPAGATAAMLLARWGQRVVLLSRQRPANRAIAESLPPSCRRLFRHLGVEQEIAAAGFLPTSGNTVWWETRAAAGDVARVEWFPAGETGWQVPSAELEELLVGLAQRDGVDVRRGHTVREVEGLEAGDGSLSVVAHTGDREERFAADWILDASGRSGVVAHQLGLRRPFEGAATLALAASWQDSGPLDLPDPSHTLVEGYGDGWAWSVPLPERRRFVAVMVDPRHTELAGDGERVSLYDAELAKTHALGSRLRGSRRTSPVIACDASCYSATRFAGQGFFLLGDAGSFIDPLSSYGVKKAMASGWLTAVCIHTMAEEPGMREACLDLYNRREQRVFDSYMRMSAAHFREGGGEGAGDFWRERSILATADTHDDDLRFDVALLREDPEVLTAFEALKVRDGVDLRLAPGVQIGPRPIVEGQRVVMAEHLISEWAPGGVRFLRDVELPRLVQVARSAGTVPELFDAYNEAGAPASLPDFLGALSVSLAKGLMEDAGFDSVSPPLR